MLANRTCTSVRCKGCTPRVKEPSWVLSKIGSGHKVALRNGHSLSLRKYITFTFDLTLN